METRHSGKDTLFIVYVIFAALYLGVQMFQGLSYRDIGIYMSGSQHFNEEPYAIYYLGQWFLTYGLTNWLCHAFSLNSLTVLPCSAIILSIFSLSNPNSSKNVLFIIYNLLFIYEYFTCVSNHE